MLSNGTEVHNGTAIQERGQTSQLAAGGKKSSAREGGSVDEERKRKLNGAPSPKQKAKDKAADGADKRAGEAGGETQSEKRRKRANSEAERRRSKSGEKASDRKLRKRGEGIVGVKARALRRHRPAHGSYLGASKGLGQEEEAQPEPKPKPVKKTKPPSTVSVESLVGRWGRRKWRMKEGGMKGFNGKIVKGPRDPTAVRASDKCYTFVLQGEGRGQEEREQRTGEADASAGHCGGRDAQKGCVVRRVRSGGEGESG